MAKTRKKKTIKKKSSKKKINSKKATKKKASTKKSVKKTNAKKRSKNPKKAAPKKTAEKVKKAATKQVTKTTAPKKASPSVDPRQHSLIGQALPNLQLLNQRGESVSLMELSQKHPMWVLYFYPKDDTPGCTMEACDFRDNLSRLQEKGVAVYGVSPDSVDSHQKFIQKYNLNFDLLSDEGKTLCEALKVWKEKSFMGRTYMGVERSTFVIREGRIVLGWQPVSVKGHVDEIIQAIQGLAS